MKTPLAWHNLIHDWLRTLVALAGVGFAVVLIFLQLGFYGSVLETATLIYSRLNYDLLLRSREYLHVSRPSAFPRVRLYQALGLPEVSSVATLEVGYVAWRNPETNQRRAILVMAFPPDERVFTLPEIIRQQSALQETGNVLLDRRSRPEFGPQSIGVSTDVGRQRLRIAGLFDMGTGFAADGAILTGEGTYRRLFPGRPTTDTSLGLIRLRSGGDPIAARNQLAAILPPDVEALTRADIERQEQRHWTTQTSVGVVLGTGVVVAVIVGVAIVYQVLASSISAHMAEYATLKAIGYSSPSMSWMVIQQALILAVIGFVPGLLVAQFLYWVTRAWAHIPVEMTWSRSAAVLCGSLAMCSLAAVLSLRKVYSADPAELF